MTKNKKLTQTFGTSYFNTRVFPSDYRLFFIKSLIFWMLINVGSILIFSIIYYFYDNKYVSKFDGLKDGKRNFYEYLYLSGMVGTLVGFGDIIAKRDPLTKFIIMGQVILTLFLNFSFISFKELKLADDPTGTFDFKTQ
jgi:hypothetical protein